MLQIAFSNSWTRRDKVNGLILDYDDKSLAGKIDIAQMGAQTLPINCGLSDFIHKNFHFYVGTTFAMLIRLDKFCLYTTKTCTMYDLKLLIKILIRSRLRVSKEDELSRIQTIIGYRKLPLCRRSVILFLSCRFTLLIVPKFVSHLSTSFTAIRFV